uniref:Uncharacterized protein n=1 Tax=viral metagenome TaxID=1070528 RepID=A0A6C0I3F9_9ZZZZ
MTHLLHRFPKFELSYETVSHKKDHYDCCLAIPVGKKVFAWFTYDGEEDVCFIADLNREKKITTLKKVDNLSVSVQLALGTVLYGTMVEEQEGSPSFFVAEDIYYFRGYSVKHAVFTERLDMMRLVLEDMNSKTIQGGLIRFVIRFVLPVINAIPIKDEKTIGYAVHHYQYRSSNKIMPYLNVFQNKKVIAEGGRTSGSNSTMQFETMNIKKDLSKPQYRYPTIFQVTADIQYDIYHLFACGKNNMPVYYDVAYIPNCKSSVFMNGLFRNIRENKNLDYIEESDDEDDFQNIKEDKYVDVNRVLLMECTFHTKFRKWIPLRVIAKNGGGNRIVHIYKLISM